MPKETHSPSGILTMEMAALGREVLQRTAKEIEVERLTTLVVQLQDEIKKLKEKYEPDDITAKGHTDDGRRKKAASGDILPDKET